MALITTIAEMQKTGVTDNNLTPTVFIPYVEKAQEQYLVKVLGDELIDELETQHSGGSLSATNLKLWNKVIKVLGPLAKYNLTPEVADKISNTGVNVSNSNDFIPSTDRGIYFLRSSLLNNGYMAIDALYRFLEKNKTDYPLWTASAAFSNYKKYFISTAEQFNEYVVINSSTWIFMQLVAYIHDVEQRYIVGTITAELFDDLKTKWLAESLSIEEKKLHQHLCRCIAQYAYAMGLKSPFVRQEIQNVIASRSENFNRNLLAKEEYAAIIQEHENLAAAALFDAISYLNKTASLTVFPLWFNSSSYKSPTEIANSKGHSTYKNDSSESSFMML